MSKDVVHDTEDYVLISGSDTIEAKKLGEEVGVISKIKSWLAPTEFDSDTSEYKKHLNSHVQGTGKWISETDQYKKWYETDEIGDLWIRGIPGSGKSVVAGNLIRQLKATGDAPVLYFFFRHIILANRSPQSLLRDCSVQLLDHSPLLQTSLNGVMKKCSSVDQVPFDELYKCFSSSLTAMKKVYCVLDALDEMDLGQDVFLADLLNLGRRYPKSIKLALTSRQLPYLEAHFKGSCLVDLRLDRINVDNDIAIYITHRLKNLQAIIMPEEAQAIKTAICDKGKGLFLYARLMMDECVRDPKRFLSQKLPDGLGNMYSDLLAEHSSRSGATQAFQQLVLEWVTHSQRPLRLMELTAVINSMADRGGLRDPQDTKKMVRICCGPLLEICEDEVVQIIHHSFTEFLCGSELSHVQMNEKDTDRFPVLDSESVHSRISIACIEYLQSGCFKEWTSEERHSLSKNTLPSGNQNYFHKGRWGVHGNYRVQELTIDFNFLPYAAEFWPLHAAKVNGGKSSLHEALEQFIFEENHSYQAWKDVWPGIESYTPADLTPLHVSASCGLRDYTKALLLRGADPDAIDGLDRSPIIYAAISGHDTTVAILLEHSARHDIIDGQGLNAVHYAAKMGHAKTLRTLLASGADALVKRSEKYPGPERTYYQEPITGQTALSYVCELGHLDALLVLLQHLDLNTMGCKPLHLAATKNQAEIIKALLQHELIASHVDDRDEQGNTALYLASGHRDPKTIKALLDGKANVNMRSHRRESYYQRHHPAMRPKSRIETESSYTALHGWARLGSAHQYSENGTDLDLIEVLDRLVNAGCDINAVDHLGRTALFGWNELSFRKTPQYGIFISSMIRHGANAKVLDFSGSSPLHNMRGHRKEIEPVQMLIDAGADINHARTSDGRTPLINATSESQLMDPTMFKDFGADFDVQDHSGNTAFHYACSSWCMEDHHAITWLSLANPTIRNNAGRIALTNFAWGNGGKGRVDAISKMVELGVDLETRDHLGRTPLLHLFCNGNHEVEPFVRELLKMGANPKAKDDEGKSALHLLARCQLSNRSRDQDIQLKYEIMEIFVKAGCKLNARDHKGNGIFHDAISKEGPWSSACSSVIAITKLGGDINFPNHEGRTALHFAAAKEDYGSPVNKEGPAGSHLDFMLRPDLMFNVNMVDLKGVSPLHIAAKVSEINVWKLIQAGAQIHATDLNGRTALHCAAESGECNIVELLVSLYSEQSISVNPTDIAGRTPLHEAARSGNRDSVVALLLAGADVKAQDKRMRSPLHAAAEFEDISFARHEQKRFDSQNNLITNPRGNYDTRWTIADGSALDKMGVVRKLENDIPQIREIVNLLLGSGADPACLDINEHTASDVAVMLGNAPVVQALSSSMTALYASEESKLKSLDPFGELMLSTEDTNLTNLLKSLDFSTDSKVLLERAISYGNDALVVEAVTSKGLSLINPDGSSPLHLIARLGKTSLMEKLLPHVSDINAFSPPLLHAAIGRSSTNTEMLHILINAGADVNAVGRDGDHKNDKSFAIAHKLATGNYWWNSKALSLVLDTGANLEIFDGYGRTPLQAALASRSLYDSRGRYYEAVGFWVDDTLDILLRGGANLNTISPKNLTPLNSALSSMRGQDVLQKLLDYGAYGGFGPVPAISSAIDSLDIVSLRTLLQAGVNPNVVYKATKTKRYEKEARWETPLFNAATREDTYGASNDATEQINIVELLLKHGADPLQAIKDDTSTILHEIASLNGIITPSMLNGVDLETRDSNQMTPLLRACHLSGYSCSAKGRTYAAIVLIKAGANIHVVDGDGWTPLHHALSTRLNSGIDLLIESGASVTAKDIDGATPFLYTFIAGPRGEYDGQSVDRNKIELLLKAGADPLERFPDGSTPLHYIAPCLLEHSSRDGRNIRGEHGAENNPSELLALKALYKRFIELGCDPEAADNDGNTPVMRYVVAEKYYNEVSPSIPPDEKDHAEFFAAHDITKVNNDGDGLLHMVAKRDESGDSDGLDGVTLFKMLLELGLDPRMENKKGMTALDFAAACGNQLVLDLFARKDGVVT